jgi:RecQ-mediated genome instability protein 1
MLLKDVLIRQGMAFLEPGNVVFKGHQTEGRVANQDRDFVIGLKTRMG